MTDFIDVLKNVGDFPTRQWSPGDGQGRPPLITNPGRVSGGTRDMFNANESGSYGWEGASNTYDDNDVAGYRRPRYITKETPLQVKRKYERNLIEATRLIKGAFDGNGYAKLMFRDAMMGNRRIQEALSISDFPNLFGDVIDRAVLANYREQPYIWNMIAKLSEVNDFRQVNRFRVDNGTGIGVLDASGNLTPIPMGGDYPEDKLTDAKYSYRVQKFGRRMPFFWETFINDDLNAIKDTPARFGRAMRRMEEYFVVKLFANNTSFFSAANLNTIVPTGVYTATNPALTITALAQAMTIMSQQLDPDGQPISVEAVTLVVPPALKVTAQNILNADYFWANDQGGTVIGAGSGTTANNTSGQRLNVANWARNIVKLAVCYYLPIVDASHGNAGWYLFADPNSGRPAIEFGKLRGHTNPDLFMKLPNSVAIGEGQMGPGMGIIPGTTNMNPMEGDFDTDSVHYKIRHVFGGTTLDPLMAVYSNGAGV